MTQKNQDREIKISHKSKGKSLHKGSQDNVDEKQTKQNQEPSPDNERPGEQVPENDKEELSDIELYLNEKRYWRGEERYTPFIVLRHVPGDGGARPLPGGTVFWHSPDVWVESSAGYNVPVAGQANRICARVNNYGMRDASWVHLRYWWANPSMAITETDAHLIGTAEAFVPAGYSVVVPCPTPWTPIIENGGHECILAEAWVPQFDPLQAPLEPVTDRHVCQKNLNVIHAMVGTEFSFDLIIGNISPIFQSITVLMRILSFKEIQAHLTSADIGYNRRMVETSRKLPLTLDLQKDSTYAVVSSTTYARLLYAATEQTAEHTKPACQPVDGVAEKVTLKPWECRTLTIRARIPSDAKHGQAYGFEFSQWMGPVVTGGYTLYVIASTDSCGHCKNEGRH